MSDVQGEVSPSLSVDLTAVEHRCDALDVSDFTRLAPSPELISWAYAFNQQWSAVSSFDGVRNAASEDLDAQVVAWSCLALDMPIVDDRYIVTSSATTALLVALGALRDPARAGIVTVSPQIDLYPGVAKLLDMPMRYVSHFEQVIDVARTSGIGTILLSSPNNPTGDTLSRDELLRLADVALECDLALVVDQCLSWAGHDDSVPYATEVLGDVDGLKLVCLWDTGKAFGLLPDREKLAFIHCSPAVYADVLYGIELVQDHLDLQRRRFFAELLREATQRRHRAFLHEVGQRNLARLSNALTNSGLQSVQVSVSAPAAVVRIDALARPNSGWQLFDELITKYAVGVAPGECFQHISSSESSFIRIATLRTGTQFEAICAALSDY